MNEVKENDWIMIKTEMRNPKTTHIDKMDTMSMLKLITEENKNSFPTFLASVI